MARDIEPAPPLAPPLTLTTAHVARAHREVTAPPHDPNWTLLSDDDLDALAHHLTAGRPRPIPIFAYGSLIWKPGFEVGDIRKATAIGWHRSFCIELNHWRGSPDCPGLMLALEPGGSCTGLVMEIAPGAEADALRTLLRRELVAHELAANARWITVETARGTEQALTFYAGTVGQTLVHLPVEEQAHRLAHACGHAGSGAEYLQRTAAALTDFGLDDPYMWRLQQLVAAQIDRWPECAPDSRTESGPPIGDV